MGLIDDILQRLFPPSAESLRDVRLGRRAVVRGRVVARDLIESPLSGERCVYYRYSLEEWRRSSVPIGFGSEGFWVLVERDEAIAEFYVQDETGRAVVFPKHAVVEAARDVTAEPLDWPLGRRGSELRINPGDLVEIEGVAEQIEDLLDEARGYRESSRRLLLRAIDGGVIRIRLIARG